MKDPMQFDDSTWRKLFAFLAPDENMTRQEVEEELQHLGIDPSPGFAKVQQALKRMASPQTSSLQPELERLYGWVRGVGQHVWQILGLEQCRPLRPALEGALSHVDDREEGEGTHDRGWDVPVSDDVKEQLPWLDKVRIVVIDSGEAAGTRCYGAQVSVVEHAAKKDGRLYIALVEQDGRKGCCNLSSNTTDRAKPFDNDLSADRGRLTVALATEG